MTLDRVEWIVAKAELREEVLSDWERRFLSEMAERLDTYGDQAFVSERQANALDRISEKVG